MHRWKQQKDQLMTIVSGLPIFYEKIRTKEQKIKKEILQAEQ